MYKPGLPAISSSLPADVRQFLERVREFASGDFIRKTDLVSAGIGTVDKHGRLLSVTPETNDLTRPPAPVNVTASGAMTNIILKWDDPHYRNFSYAEIYRSPSELFDAAVHVGVTSGTLYSDPVPQDSSYWYWVRFWSKADVDGPWHGTAGIHGQTAKDPEYLMDTITGNDPTVPFVTLAEDTEINGVMCPAGVYMKNAYMAMLVAKRGQIGALAVDDAAIANLSAAKVTFGEMSGDRIAARSMNVDRLATGTLAASEDIFVGGNLRLSGQGWIESYALGGYNRAGDYARLDSGSFSLYRYIPALGTSTLYSYLSRLETGIANSGDTVLIPGYWKHQPKVIVSPAGLMLYRKDYQAQDQAITCTALNIVETAAGSMQWKFDATATLNLSAGSGVQPVNSDTGDQSIDSFYSSQNVTPANCTQITPSVTLRSIRGNGASQYYYRSVRWRIEYFGSGAWVPSVWRTVDIGAQMGGISDSMVFTFPSSGTWTWRVYCEAYDTNGTVFGTASVEYSTETTGVNSGSVSANAACGDSVQSNQNTSAALVLPSSSLNTSWEIYEITYSCSLSGNLAGNANSNGPYIRVSNFDSSTRIIGANGAVGPVTKTKTVSGSGLSYDSNYLKALAVCWGTNVAGTSTYLWQTAQATVSNGYAIIKRRRAVPSSTTPTNGCYVNAYNYALTTAQVLATGTLNWMAVGE